MKYMKNLLFQGIVLLAAISLTACQITTATGMHQPTQENTGEPDGTPSVVDTAAKSISDPLPTVAPVPPVYRVLRIDYPDLGGSRSIVANLEQHARATGFNMIALGAGRVEWTYFMWAGHESVWANDVKDSQSIAARDCYRVMTPRPLPRSGC